MQINVTKRWKGDHWAVIASLVMDRNIQTIVEVGVFKSKMLSAILRSEASNVIKSYFAVDPWLPFDIHEEFLAKNQNNITVFDGLYKQACKLMTCFTQLHVIRLPSVEAATLFADNSLDLVFIDGDHRYDFVKNDIYAWMPKVKVGGILSGHDYMEKVPERIKRWIQVKEAVDEVFKSKVSKLDSYVWAVVKEE